MELDATKYISVHKRSWLAMKIANAVLCVLMVFHVWLEADYHAAIQSLTKSMKAATAQTREFKPGMTIEPGETVSGNLLDFVDPRDRAKLLAALTNGAELVGVQAGYTGADGKVHEFFQRWITNAAGVRGVEFSVTPFETNAAPAKRKPDSRGVRL